MKKIAVVPDRQFYQVNTTFSRISKNTRRHLMPEEIRKKKK